MLFLPTPYPVLHGSLSKALPLFLVHSGDFVFLSLSLSLLIDRLLYGEWYTNTWTLREKRLTHIKQGETLEAQ